MSIKIRFLKNQKTKIISAFDTILDCDIDSLKLNINNENVFSFINNKTICTAIIKEYDKSREFFYEHYDVQFLNDISYNYNFNTKHREYCILYIDDIEISGGLCTLKRITEQNNILYFEIEILNQIEDLYEKSKGIQLNELGNYNIIWNEDNIKTLLSDEINGFSLVPLNDGESVRQDSINTSIKTIFDTNTIPVAINVNKILNDGLSKLGLSIRDNSFLNSEYINNLWIFDNKSEILEFYQEESQELLDISYEDISYNSIEKYTIKSIESFIGMTGMTGMTGLEYSIYTKKYNSNISPLNIEKKENEKYNFTYKYINTEYDSNFSDYTNKNISSITLVGNTKYNIKINNIDCIINSTNDIDIYRIHTILKFKNTKTNEDEIYNFYSDITPIGTTTNLNIEFEKYIKDNTIVTIYSQEELGILFSNENDKEYDFNITKNISSYSLIIEKIKNDKKRIIGEELNLFSQIPNISLYDVLSGLQQMFNLVFKITDNTIDAITLKNYYDKSKYINIDKYVNYDKEIIIKPSIDEFKYNNISLKYDVNKADYYNLYSYLYDNREYGEYKSSIETYNKDKINIKNPLSICKTGTYKYNNLLEFTSSFNINNENLLKVTPSKCFIGYKELKTFDIPLDTIYLYYDENNYNSYNQNKYNIFTHICSAIDYCYDTPKFIFFKTTEYQQKNLFSEFFYENIQENISEQGKIITLFANINIETLQQLYSINVVYYKNIYWKLLEIKNWQYYDNNVILKLLKIIDIENINLNNKKIIKIDINQNYLKPILIDEQFLSGNFLNELSDNAAIISTSKELFNLHDILLDISNLQEGISGASGIYEEINEINNEINLINTDISGIHLAITGINTDLSGIHSAISGINTDLSGIHLAITGINTDLSDIHSSITGINTDLSGIHSSITGINTDLSDIHSSITGINTDIDNINTDLSDIHLAITGINTDLSDIHSSITSINTDLSGIHLAITGINTDLSDIHSSITGINTDLSGIHSSITGINTDLSGIHSSITGINTNIAQLQNDIRYLQDSICKYDKYDYAIIECLLPGGTEIEFPDYTNFDGLRAWPVVEIKNTAFQNIRFTGDFVMNNLEVANDYEFQSSIFTGNFEGEKINHVGYYAFYNSNFSGELDLPNCKFIGLRALRYSKFSGSLSLPVCTVIGDYALQYSQFSGSLNLPMCTKIGSYAFGNSVFSGSLSLPVCEQIGINTFRLSKFSGSLSLPVCKQIGYEAFYYSNFDEITIGANANLGTNCIGAHSTEFINDYTANNKLAGTYVWDAGTNHWIYQG